MTFERLRELALALPETREVTSYGTPAFKVRDKLFARLREDGSYMVKTAPGYKEVLLEAQPDRYFTTPHYDGYDAVLVRPENADEGDLNDLLIDAWLIAAPKRLAASYRAALSEIEDEELP